MKRILFGISAAGMVGLLAGCQSTYDTGGVGSYGYSYDLNLPAVSGSPVALQTLGTATPAYVSTAPALTPQASGAQSVVFYEGAQPAPSATVVAGTTPVWTAPAPVASIPGAVPGAAPAPTVNEAAGAATGGAVAGGTGVVGGGAVGVPGVDGGISPTVVLGGGGGFVGTNELQSSNPGVVINNTNSVILTNGTVMTNANTNGFPSTNAVGTITNSNGTISVTNFSGGPTNFSFTNGNTAANSGATPATGATNNQNNLPRASGPTAGTPPGTALVPNRTIGEPAGAQVSPSPNIPAGAITPSTTPTQPGPSTTAAGSTTTTGAATGTQTGTQTVIGGVVPPGAQGAQGASAQTQTGTGTTVVTPNSAQQQQQQRQLLLQQQAAQQQSAQGGQTTTQGTQTTTQGSQQAAPAPAPAAPKK